MKLYIKLDDWTKKQWEDAKSTLERHIELEFKKPVAVSKLDVLQYLIICFEDGSTPGYVELFDEEEVEAMHKRKLGLLKKFNNEPLID